MALPLSSPSQGTILETFSICWGFSWKEVPISKHKNWAGKQTFLSAKHALQDCKTNTCKPGLSKSTTWKLTGTERVREETQPQFHSKNWQQVPDAALILPFSVCPCAIQAGIWQDINVWITAMDTWLVENRSSAQSTVNWQLRSRIAPIWFTDYLNYFRVS